MNLQPLPDQPPEEPSPERVKSDTESVAAAESNEVSLDELLSIAAVDDRGPFFHPVAGNRRAAVASGWFCLADRILGEWPRTFRASLLIGLLLAGLVPVLVALVGIWPTLSDRGIRLRLPALLDLPHEFVADFLCPGLRVRPGRDDLLQVQLSAA